MKILLLLFVDIFFAMENNNIYFSSGYNQYQKKIIAEYIYTAFNVTQPSIFTSWELILIYQSPNLRENIQTTIQFIKTQATEKNSSVYYDALRKNEEQLQYAIALEWFKSNLDFCIEVIQKHCTIPIESKVKSVLLEELWYSYWALILPTRVSASSSFEETLFINFIAGCMQAKKVSNSNCNNVKGYIGALEKRCYAIKEEIKKVDILNQYMQLCDNLFNLFNRLKRLKNIKTLNKYAVLKNQGNNFYCDINKLIINMLEVFWNSYWHNIDNCSSNEKKKLMAEIEKSIQAINI
ncbi:hypothetical protein EKK58_06455 [Candidatus Dependentiae bacterium]|nr:MAG: hypothetical protein EKK58_06455 [Candidatus Dependentiae bacterium]